MEILQKLALKEVENYCKGVTNDFSMGFLDGLEKLVPIFGWEKLIKGFNNQRRSDIKQIARLISCDARTATLLDLARSLVKCYASETRAIGEDVGVFVNKVYGDLRDTEPKLHKPARGGQAASTYREKFQSGGLADRMYTTGNWTGGPHFTACFKPSLRRAQTMRQPGP